MDDSSFNSITYTIEKKVEGKYALQRIAYITGAVLLSIILCALCIISKLLVYLTPVVFMLCIIIFKYLFIYFQIEYRYTIERGIFTMEKVFGARKCKKYYEVKIADADKILPYADIDFKKDDIIYQSCVSTATPTPDLYAIIAERDGARCIALFEATKKTLKIMKYHNKNTVITEGLRH